LKFQKRLIRIRPNNYIRVLFILIAEGEIPSLYAHNVCRLAVNEVGELSLVLLEMQTIKSNYEKKRL